MRVTPVKTTTVVLAGVLGSALLAAPGAAADDSGLTPAERRAQRDPGQVFRTPGQTSDGEPGIRVQDLSGMRKVKARTENDASYTIAPGITVRQWDQVDGRQPVGRVRAHLVTVDLTAPNISMDVLNSKYIVKRKPVSTISRWRGALVGVNADFFDISDTGAPLGMALSSKGGLVNGNDTGWVDGTSQNATLWRDDAGWHVGDMIARAKIRQHPRWKSTGLNVATIERGDIGIYTPAWGWTKGYSVTDGKRFAREVVVNERGRVVSNRPRLSKGKKIKGLVVIGRNKGAKLLKRYRRGMKIKIKTKTLPAANVAVSGDRPILLDGVRTVVNDTLAHPRTAVGIDQDGQRMLILTIDGRSSTSRGYTMVELANLMTALGAEDAINFDGGGSSTMYTRRLSGEMGVVNAPSDGQERSVANGFGVFYSGALPAPTPVPSPTVTPTP